MKVNQDHKNQEKDKIKNQEKDKIKNNNKYNYSKKKTKNKNKLKNKIKINKEMIHLNFKMKIIHPAFERSNECE